jgi:hypothetical protein
VATLKNRQQRPEEAAPTVMSDQQYSGMVGKDRILKAEQDFRDARKIAARSNLGMSLGGGSMPVEDFQKAAASGYDKARESVYSPLEKTAEMAEKEQKLYTADLANTTARNEQIDKAKLQKAEQEKYNPKSRTTMLAKQSALEMVKTMPESQEKQNLISMINDGDINAFEIEKVIARHKEHSAEYTAIKERKLKEAQAAAQYGSAAASNAQARETNIRADQRALQTPLVEKMTKDMLKGDGKYVASMGPEGMRVDMSPAELKRQENIGSTDTEIASRAKAAPILKAAINNAKLALTKIDETAGRATGLGTIIPANTYDALTMALANMYQARPDALKGTVLGEIVKENSRINDNGILELDNNKISQGIISKRLSKKQIAEEINRIEQEMGDRAIIDRATQKLPAHLRNDSAALEKVIAEEQERKALRQD